MNTLNHDTELMFILDKSGSMSGLEADTVGGFNSLIEKQKGEEGECYVSTLLFDDKQQLLHDRLTLDKIQPMTRRDYVPGGCTALLDAVGWSIEHISAIQKYARAEDVPAHTLVIITTDGMENASRKYDRRQVKTLIEEKRSAGWEFIFLGANIDAGETAESMGISRDCAVDYHADGEGTGVAFDAMNSAVNCMRSEQPMTSQWKVRAEKDFKSRKANR